MSIVSDYELYDFLGKDDSAEEYSYYATVRDAVEKWVQNYCGRTFESTVYKERCDGSGSSKLILKNYPITSINRLALSKEDAMMVRNTGTTTHATVSVNSTGIVLSKDGLSNSSVTFATYTTLQTVVNAINAISGWEAALVSSTFANYQSTELIPAMGLYCLNSTWAYLSIPYEAESDFDVDEERGIITLFGFGFENFNGIYFPFGTRNIFVYYTAGYTSTTMPEDLKFAIKTMCKILIKKTDEDTAGIRSYMTGRVSVTFDISPDYEFPTGVTEILMKYRRVNL